MADERGPADEPATPKRTRAAKATEAAPAKRTRATKATEAAPAKRTRTTRATEAAPAKRTRTTKAPAVPVSSSDAAAPKRAGAAKAAAAAGSGADAAAPKRARATKAAAVSSDAVDTAPPKRARASTSTAPSADAGAPKRLRKPKADGSAPASGPTADVAPPKRPRATTTALRTPTERPGGGGRRTNASGAGGGDRPVDDVGPRRGFGFRDVGAEARSSDRPWEQRGPAGRGRPSGGPPSRGGRLPGNRPAFRPDAGAARFDDRSDRPQRADRSDRPPGGGPRFGRDARPAPPWDRRPDSGPGPGQHRPSDRSGGPPGGRPRPDRFDRSDRFDRTDRGGPADRPQRFDRGGPADRPQRFDRPDRGGPDRPQRFDRGGPADRPRSDRPPRFDRSDAGDRPRFDRPDRGPGRTDDAPWSRRPSGPPGQRPGPARPGDRPWQAGAPRPSQPWRDRPAFDQDRPPAGPEPVLVAEGEELIAGRRPVEEAFVARRDAHRLIVVPQRRQALEKLVLHATSLRIPVVEVEGGTLTAVAGFDGHQGIALVVGPRRFASIDEILARAVERREAPFVLALDSLEDPQNLGTLLRSAEAAGVHGVVFPTRRQAPLSAAAVKASAGAVEHLLLCPVDDLPGALADLRARGLRIAGAEAEAPLTARQADLRGPLAIVVGSEGHGLAPTVRRRVDLLVRIPMRGAVGSLNAAVAGSILLFEVLSQRDPDGTAPVHRPAPLPGPAADRDAEGGDSTEPEPEPEPDAGQAGDPDAAPTAAEAPAPTQPEGADPSPTAEAAPAPEPETADEPVLDPIPAGDSDDLLPGGPIVAEDSPNEAEGDADRA